MTSRVLGRRFELVSEVGRGGMAVVYRARDHQRGRDVAVKLALDDHDARFAREIRLLAALDHPGVASFVAAGRDEGREYLVQEWLEGATLRERLMNPGLTLGESVALGRRLAETLAAVHRADIVHRDVKPSNIILEDDDPARPRLIDFGAARQDHATVLTRTGVVIGTPRYMSPEQAMGRQHLDARTDLFSLGCVLYECVTGRPAFAGDNDLALWSKVLLVEPPPLQRWVPDVPPTLAALIAALLAKEPDRRPTAADVIVSLERVSTDSPVRRPLLLDDPTPTVELAPRAPARRFVVLVLMLIDPDDSRDPAASAATFEAHRAIADEFGGRFHRLRDDSQLVEFASSHASPLRGALDCGRRIARHTGAALVGVAELPDTEGVPADQVTGLDLSLRALRNLEMSLLWARDDAGVRELWVGSAVADQLGDGVSTRPAEGGVWLIADDS